MISSSQVILGSGLVFGSVFWVELVRDLYHALAHLWRPAYRLHAWHHRVFRPDFTPSSLTIYRKAHWYNDVPESLVMLLGGLIFWRFLVGVSSPMAGLGLGGAVYTLFFFAAAIARGLGFPYVEEMTDITHRPGQFSALPGQWLVNRPYHWRHHFDNQDAYFCGTFTFLDRIWGTALSLKGKRIAVTGASGALGQALLREFHQAGAKAIALTSKSQSCSITIDSEEILLDSISWSVGEETALADMLADIDILVLNHGVNVHSNRTSDAVERSFRINTFSQQRLMALFLGTVKTNQDRVRKEIWVNTSEAEVTPAFSPLYELSKRTLGDLVTLQRLDAPIVIRKLILGPFKSSLNPVGVLSADWVARRIIGGARRDFRNIIVTINPLTYLLFPPKEFFVSLYFKLFTRKV